MIVDGKQIAERTYENLTKQIVGLSNTPVLSIITCAPNFETRKYLELKQKKATAVGIRTVLIELPSQSSTDDFICAVRAAEAENDGIIVQLPLPEGVDVAAVLNAVPPTHDVDALNPMTTELRSPVVAAIAEILKSERVNPEGKQAVILGRGKLVGLPAERWFKERGATVTVVTQNTSDIGTVTRAADIIVCGAGKPGLLTPDMLKDGAVILDAGTSEEGGVLRGDADPACAAKASLFTPVPGGIGPVTVAMLLQNVVHCAARNARVV